MTRTQALERIPEVLAEIDALATERKKAMEDFKLRREILETDLRMCRGEVDQMTLEEAEG